MFFTSRYFLMLIAINKTIPESNFFHFSLSLSKVKEILNFSGFLPLQE